MWNTSQGSIILYRTVQTHTFFSSFFYVGMGKLELEKLELENYFGSFYKKRINHKDFQLSTA
jgi:hypothetical protein